MKLQGIFGKGSGKVGSSVFAVVGGQQIVREYNPKVSNPQTEAQVAQRAKLKLMSQLAVVFASVIGFTKQGLVSARNRFIKANIGNVSYSDEIATARLDFIDLTGGVLPLPSINCSLDGGFALSSQAPENVNALLVCVVQQNANSKLVVTKKVLVTDRGAGNNFATQLGALGGASYVYAYGFMFGDNGNSAAYGNYDADISDDTAQLESIIKSLVSKATLTNTVCAMVDE